MKWTDLVQFDIFISGIKGSDNIINHTTGIYKKWMFIANEKLVILFYQRALEYILCIKDTRETFMSFTDGFYFWKNSKQKKLKRKAKGDVSSILY